MCDNVFQYILILTPVIQLHLCTRSFNQIQTHHTAENQSTEKKTHTNKQQTRRTMSKNNGTNTTTTTTTGTPTQQLDFPSVLNFLQKEYRKMENERQLWELERSEYKRTINFLEGSRKSHERIQYDLLRRVKMLEYVLRSER